MKKQVKCFSKVLLTGLMAVIICAMLSACGAAFTFGKYGYSNSENPTSNWRDLKYGDGMKVDGAIDEAVWSTVKPTSFTADGVTMTTKVYMGETGAFFAMSTDDPWVFFNGHREIHHNTGVELYVSPTNGALTKNTLQLRFALNGDIHQYIGIKTEGAAPWTRVYVPVMSRIKIDGELNTPTCKGYSVEAFMPYSSLGLKGKPQKLYTFSAFNRISDGNDDSKRLGWFSQVGATDSPSSYYLFEQSGYPGADVEGSLMGDRPGYPKSGGWDLTYAADSDNPVVSTIGGGDQVIYFKDINSQKYSVSVYVERNRAIDDKAPKAGILAAENGSGRSIAVFDVSQPYTKDLFAVTRESSSGADWNWPGLSYYNGSVNYSAGLSKSKLTVARYENMFYYFVNDIYMYSQEISLFAGENTVAGLYTMGCAADFVGMKYSSDETEVLKIISSVKNEDTTNNWKQLGDFDAVSPDSVTLRASGANVGGANNKEIDERYIRKTGITLSGDFELSYTVGNLSYSEDIPDWMNPYLTTRLYRKGSAENDRIMMRTYKKPQIQMGIGASEWDAAEEFDSTVDFTKPHRITLVSKLPENSTKSGLYVYFDGVLLKGFAIPYRGDYEFGFSGNYIAGEVTDIFAGAIKNYAVNITAGENGTATSLPVSAPIGENVIVTVTPEAGYSVASFTVNGVDSLSLLHSGKAEIYVGGETDISVTFAARSSATQTVTGTVSMPSGVSVNDLTAVIYDASAEFPLTLASDGKFSVELSEGVYTLSIKHTDEHYEPFTQAITVNEALQPLNVEVKATDPTLDADLEAKADFYYTNARKAAIGAIGDAYVYFGNDSFYIMFDILDDDVRADSTVAVGLNDWFEFGVTVGDLNGTRRPGKSFYFLITPDGSGTYNRINESNQRYADNDGLRPQIGNSFAKVEENGSVIGCRMEFKIPYSLFGLTEKPEILALLPGYHNTEEGDSALKQPPNMNEFFPATNCRFNETGHMAIKGDELTIDGDLSDWKALPEFSVVGDAQAGTGF